MISIASISALIFNIARTSPIIASFIRRFNYNKPLSIEAVDAVFGTLDVRIRNAKSTLWISGNDLAAINSRSAAIEAALAAGRQVRVMYADSSLADILSEFDDRFQSADHFIDQVNSTRSTLRRLSTIYPNLQVRSSRILAPCGLFITDHEMGFKDRFVKIELYACKPVIFFPRSDLASGRAVRLNMVMSDKDRWDDYYVQQFQNLWEKAYDEEAIAIKQLSVNQISIYDRTSIKQNIDP